MLEYREPFTYDCFDGDWCARNRVNSSSGRLEAKHGGKVKFADGFFVHTFNRLVPPDDEGALSAAMGEMLADSDAAARLGAAARRRAETEFPVPRMVERTAESLRRAVESRRAE